MSEFNGMAPDLTPEQQARAKAAIERMIRRHRDGNYRTNPPVPAKLESIATGMHVVQEASGPPVPIPGLDVAALMAETAAQDSTPAPPPPPDSTPDEEKYAGD